MKTISIFFKKKQSVAISCTVAFGCFLGAVFGLLQVSPRSIINTLGIPSTMKPLPQQGVSQFDPYSASIDVKQLPIAFLSNLEPYRLVPRDLKIIQVLPGGEFKLPQENPFQSTLVQVSVSVTAAEVLASANYAGRVEFWDQFSDDLGKEVDGNAVTVGLSALERLAKEYDIVIIIGGNEGKIRDEAPAMPLGKVLNPQGKKGIYLYIGDCLEITNGIKSKQGGQNGSSALMALIRLDENGMPWSHDGYRSFMALPPQVGTVAISDSVVQGKNTLSVLIGEMGLQQSNDFFTLERPKHDEMIAQAKALGFRVVTAKDGDPVPAVLRSIFGIPDEEGRRLVVASTGGGNEAFMALIVAILHAKSPFTSSIVSHVSLKEVDAKEKGTGNGSMSEARYWKGKDIGVIQEGNQIMSSLNSKYGTNIHLLPETSEELNDSIQTQDSFLWIRGNAVLAQSSVTGGRSVDAGVAQPLLPAVTWHEAEDGSGEVHVSGFVVNEEGDLYFYNIGLASDSVRQSRFQILMENEYVRLFNPILREYQEKRSAYREMIQKGAMQPELVEAYWQFLMKILGQTQDQAVMELKRRLEIEWDLVKKEKEDPMSYTHHVRRLISGAREQVDQILLGVPFVKTEKGEQYSIVQRSPYIEETELAGFLLEENKNDLGKLLDPTVIRSLRVDQIISLLSTFNRVIRDHFGNQFSSESWGQQVIQSIRVAGIPECFLNNDSVMNVYDSLMIQLTRSTPHQLMRKPPEEERWKAIANAVLSDNLTEVKYGELGDLLFETTDENRVKQFVTEEFLTHWYDWVIANASLNDSVNQYAEMLGRWNLMASILGFASLGNHRVEFFKNALFSKDPKLQKIASAFFAGYAKVGETDSDEMIQRFKEMVDDPDRGFDAVTRYDALRALRGNASNVDPKFFIRYLVTKQRQDFRIRLEEERIVDATAGKVLLEGLGLPIDEYQHLIWNRYFSGMARSLLMLGRYRYDNPKTIPLIHSVVFMKLFEEFKKEKLSLEQARQAIIRIASRTTKIYLGAIEFRDRALSISHLPNQGTLGIEQAL